VTKKLFCNSDQTNVDWYNVIKLFGMGIKDTYIHTHTTCARARTRTHTRMHARTHAQYLLNCVLSH